MDVSVEGKIYINGTFENACLGIKKGQIVEIKKILKSDNHFDFGNKLILPAGIDVHVHFRDPGMTHKEDFSTGSMAAAYGGISSVFDMPNTNPQTTNTALLSEKISSFKKKSFVDFGLYCAVTNDNIDKIEKIGKKCNGFKIYLGSTTLSLLLDKKNLKNAFENISKTGKPVLIHAEDEECLIQHRMQETNINDHLSSRPSICEEISIKEVLNASKNSGARVHICHVSSCEGIELLKNRTGGVSFGVTPHHSLLSVDNETKNALLTVMLTDKNPGVRLEALKVLKRLPYDEIIKQGFLTVLTSDTTSGLRIEAVNAISELIEKGLSFSQDELSLLKERLINDDNDYIKFRSATILKEYN